MSALISHGVWFCGLVRLAVGVTLRNFGCDPSVYFGKFTFLQFGRESNKVGRGVRFQLDKISARDDVFGKLARSCGHGKFLLGSK
jgi:hypothetical protein